MNVNVAPDFTPIIKYALSIKPLLFFSLLYAHAFFHDFQHNQTKVHILQRSRARTQICHVHIRTLNSSKSQERLQMNIPTPLPQSYQRARGQNGACESCSKKKKST